MDRLRGPVFRHRMLQIAADALLAALAFFLAFQLRFFDEFRGMPPRYSEMLWESIVFVAIGKSLIFTVARPAPEVVALLQPRRQLEDRPRLGRRLGPDAGRVHARAAVRDQHPALGPDPRLPAHGRPPDRRPQPRPLLPGVPLEGVVQARPQAPRRGAGPARADRRRRLRRPDGRPRADAESGPRPPRRLRRRRPEQASARAPPPASRCSAPPRTWRRSWTRSSPTR